MIDGGAVLSWRDVSKRFGSVRALDGLTLSVERGEVFGFLGPNGAGKTTALRIAAGLIRPDRGEASLIGIPVGEKGSRRKVGYLPEEIRMPRRLRLGEWLGHQIRLRAADPSRIAPAAERVGLASSLGREVAGFSKGMRRRAALALLAASDPELWLLDEPTADLDVSGREMVENLILEARGRGATFFISSHILSEVERVCDRVGIIEGGRLRKTAAPAELLPAPLLVDLSLPTAPADPAPLARGRPFRWNAEAKRLRVFVQTREEGEDVVRSLGDAGYPPVQTLHRPASLRDAIEGHLS